MVWSLFYSSLVSIANGIKDGTILHPHMLPPKLRQCVLDTVLQRRLINEPNCMALLSSVEFLNGMESFGTKPGWYKKEFLDRLEISMATMLPNGGTVGAGITKLNLSVYSCDACPCPTSCPFVARLIANCPNTISLALRGTKSIFPRVLSKNDVRNLVMENLADLSLRDLENVLSSDWPMINFKRLTTLKLDNCTFQNDIWPEFLINVPTLVNLHIIGVEGYYGYVNRYGLDWILPVSMPHLQSLEIVSLERHTVFECTKAFVDNLMGCKELRRVHLMLDQNSTDEDSLVRLANMNIDLRVKARLSDLNSIVGDSREYEIASALDSSSRFKIMRIFHGRIDSCELSVIKWMPEYTTAVQDAIDSCSNMTTFGLEILTKAPKIGPDPADDEMERINATLLQFFGNQDRAMLLKDLRLVGEFDESVILAVFQFCLDLDRLKISRCPAVRDQHLIDWVSNGGGQLKRLDVVCCPNVSSEGIIPILAKSSEGLLHIRISNCYRNQGNGEGRNWQTMLSNLCPYAETKYW